MSRTTVFLVDGEEVEGAKAAAHILRCDVVELSRPIWRFIDGEIRYRGHAVERVGMKSEYYLDGKPATYGECAAALGYSAPGGMWGTLERNGNVIARNGHVVRRAVW